MLHHESRPRAGSRRSRGSGATGPPDLGGSQGRDGGPDGQRGPVVKRRHAFRQHGRLPPDVSPLEPRRTRCGSCHSDPLHGSPTCHTDKRQHGHCSRRRTGLRRAHAQTRGPANRLGQGRQCAGGVAFDKMIGADPVEPETPRRHPTCAGMRGAAGGAAGGGSSGAREPLGAGPRSRRPAAGVEVPGCWPGAEAAESLGTIEMRRMCPMRHALGNGGGRERERPCVPASRVTREFRCCRSAGRYVKLIGRVASCAWHAPTVGDGQMIRLGNRIRLTRKEVERFTMITGFEPVDVKTLDDLADYVRKCTTGAPRRTPGSCTT